MMYTYDRLLIYSYTYYHYLRAVNIHIRACAIIRFFFCCIDWYSSLHGGFKSSTVRNTLDASPRLCCYNIIVIRTVVLLQFAEMEVLWEHGKIGGRRLRLGGDINGFRACIIFYWSESCRFLHEHASHTLLWSSFIRRRRYNWYCVLKVQWREYGLIPLFFRHWSHTFCGKNIAKHVSEKSKFALISFEQCIIYVYQWNSMKTNLCIIALYLKSPDDSTFISRTPVQKFWYFFS